MKARESSTAAEFERSTKLKGQAERLRRENRELRETLHSVRQELRQERARARKVSRVLNPRLLQASQSLAVPQRENRGAALIFLRSELQLSQTFLAMALQATNPEKRSRNLRNARIAYESLTRFYRKALMSKQEAKRFDRGIAELKKALTELGESA